MGMRELALIVAIINVIFIAFHSYALGKLVCRGDSHMGFHLFMAVIHGTAGIASMLLNY